jgi:hypothetical protein
VCRQNKLRVNASMSTFNFGSVGLHHDGQPSNPVHVWLPEGGARRQECLCADVSAQRLECQAVLHASARIWPIRFQGNVCTYWSSRSQQPAELSSSMLWFAAGPSHTAQGTTASFRYAATHAPMQPCIQVCSSRMYYMQSWDVSAASLSPALA